MSQRRLAYSSAETFKVPPRVVVIQLGLSIQYHRAVGQICPVAGSLIAHAHEANAEGVPESFEQIEKGTSDVSTDLMTVGAQFCY